MIHVTFYLPAKLGNITLNYSGTLTLSFRQATQAVIFRDISGIFLSPKDSRNAIAADPEAMLSTQLAGCNIPNSESYKKAIVRRCEGSGIRPTTAFLPSRRVVWIPSHFRIGVLARTGSKNSRN